MGPGVPSAARKNAQSIELDVAWTEWQTAEAAKLAFFRVLSLRAQVEQARQIDSDLRQTVELLQKAVEQHQKSVLDLAAAQAASADAHTAYLALQQELERQTLELKRTIGVPPDGSLPLQTGSNEPAPVAVPDPRELTSALERQRLDLLGLRVGYESQDEKLHAAVLAQLRRVGQRGRPAGVVALQPVQLGQEVGVQSGLLVADGQLVQRGDECLGDEPTAVAPEVAPWIRLSDA